jgi:hypothetical protein
MLIGGDELSPQSARANSTMNMMTTMMIVLVMDFSPSSDCLRRNDWLSSLIGALLCRLGCGRGAP